MPSEGSAVPWAASMSNMPSVPWASSSSSRTDGASEGYSQVRTSYLNFGEALFADEEGKDVRLQTKDGAAMAHSAVLRAISKPFRQMLSGEMSESRSKTIELSDMTRAEIVFFLRLLYTGQVDESDWGGLSGTPSWQVTVPEDAEPASALLLNGVYSAAGTFRGAPKFLNSNQVLLYRGSDEEASGPYWKLSWKEDGEDDDDDEEEVQDRILLEQLWSHENVTGEIPDHKIGWDFSQRGGTACIPPSGTWTHDRGVGIWGSPGKHPVMVAKIDNPPLNLLLSALGFAKKYIVEYMVRWLVEATWERLNTSSFEQILATAIHLDISPLRLRCLRFAEGSSVVRARYESGGITEPLVAFELQAIWPQRESKRRRIF
eukprot:TRINITY_DN94950_c0_g1_i1.p1 TRINITY_DN94950_c0_g1~~TRINITY_DN94950_c0_g1_i1.p1  ORF type:complete len:374 (-),score=80.02 TRINITY_DN94950_c0_g1_i1:39-1160(-)